MGSEMCIRDRKKNSRKQLINHETANSAPKLPEIEVTKCYIQSLFHRKLDHVLEKIFLMLSLDDLERCKTVCKEWNRFMKAHVWGSQSCMKILYPRWKARLEENWDKVS